MGWYGEMYGSVEVERSGAALGGIGRHGSARGIMGRCEVTSGSAGRHGEAWAGMESCRAV